MRAPTRLPGLPGKRIHVSLSACSVRGVATVRARLAPVSHASGAALYRPVSNSLLEKCLVSKCLASEFYSRGYATSSLPPHRVLVMPALSPTMDAGTLSKWLKAPGDAIESGDALAEIETDKASITWEAADEGFLAKQLVKEGQKEVPVGSPVCVVVDEQKDVEAFKNAKMEDFGAGSSAAAPAESKAAEQASPTESQSPMHLLPSVARLVATHHLEPRSIKPSGTSPSGKPVLLKGDVLEFLENNKSGAVQPPAAQPKREASKPAAAKPAASKPAAKAPVQPSGTTKRSLEIGQLAQVAAAVNGSFPHLFVFYDYCLTSLHPDAFGTALSVQSLLLLSAVRALEAAGLIDPSGDVVVSYNGQKRLIRGAVRMGAESLSFALESAETTQKDAHVSFDSDAALLSFSAPQKGASPNAGRIQFGKDPVREVFGDIPKKEALALLPTEHETEADAVLARALSSFLTGRFKPAPQFDAYEMAGLEPGKHKVKGLKVTATGPSAVLDIVARVESGAGVLL